MNASRSSSHQHGVRRQGRDRRRPAGPGHSGDANDAASFDRTRPKLVDRTKFDLPAAKALLDKIRLPRQGRRRLARPSRRQAVQPCHRQPDIRHLPPVRRAVEKEPDAAGHPGRISSSRSSRTCSSKARAGQLQMCGLGNTAATPEGFGFFGLLYGPNAGLSNLPRFNLPQFNELYAKGKRMQNGPERDKVIRQLSELVNIYAPMKLTAYRFDNVLVQPWLVGVQVHAVQLESLALLGPRSRRCAIPCSRSNKRGDTAWRPRNSDASGSRHRHARALQCGDASAYNCIQRHPSTEECSHDQNADDHRHRESNRGARVRMGHCHRRVFLRPCHRLVAELAAVALAA